MNNNKDIHIGIFLLIIFIGLTLWTNGIFASTEEDQEPPKLELKLQSKNPGPISIAVLAYYEDQTKPIKIYEPAWVAQALNKYIAFIGEARDFQARLHMITDNTKEGLISIWNTNMIYFRNQVN